MMCPLVRQLAEAAGAQVQVPVAVACRVLGFSRQAFYAWLADPISDHDLANAHLTDAAIDIHHDDPEFGYRFIADELDAARFLSRSQDETRGFLSPRRLWIGRLLGRCVDELHRRRAG